METPLETKPLPAVALTAFALLRSTLNREAEIVASQIQELQGFTKAEGWAIDLNAGIATRPVSDDIPPSTQAE